MINWFKKVAEGVGRTFSAPIHRKLDALLAVNKQQYVEIVKVNANLTALKVLIQGKTDPATLAAITEVLKQSEGSLHKTMDEVEKIIAGM